jgi:hypothetical protein
MEEEQRQSRQEALIDDPFPRKMSIQEIPKTVTNHAGLRGRSLRNQAQALEQWCILR